VERLDGKHKVYIPDPRISVLDADIDVAAFELAEEMSAVYQRLQQWPALQSQERAKVEMDETEYLGMFNPSSVTEGMVQNAKPLFQSLARGCLEGMDVPSTVPGLLWAIFFVLCEAVMSVTSEATRERQRAQLQNRNRLVGVPINDTEFFYDRARKLRQKLQENEPISLLDDIRSEFLLENPSTWAYLLSLLLLDAIPPEERTISKSRTVRKSFWMFRIYCAVERTWSGWTDVTIRRDGAAPRRIRDVFTTAKSSRAQAADLEAIADALDRDMETMS